MTAVILVGSLIASRYLTGGGPEFEVATTRQLTNESGLEITPAFSPDGKMLAYAAGQPGRTSIMVRQVGGGDAIRLANGLAPQWSSDGSKLVYVDSAGIRLLGMASAYPPKAPTTGGPVPAGYDTLRERYLDPFSPQHAVLTCLTIPKSDS